MNTDQLMNRKAEELARKRYQEAYYCRDTSSFSARVWAMRVRECIPDAAYLVNPKVIRRRWAAGRFLVCIRQFLGPFNRLLLKLGI